MNKRLLVFAALVIVGFFIRYLVVYEDFYVDLRPDAPVRVDAKADGEKLYIQNEAGYEPFVIKGVVMESFLPAYYDNDFPVKEDIYYNWMEMLAAMGANTICVHTVLNPDFYDALYRFNTTSPAPLYLLQGVSVSDYSQNNSRDAAALIEELIQGGRKAVDVIHGRELMALGRMKGGGNYVSNVSPWVLGYLLGNEWVGYTVAYTNALHADKAPYQGEFFSAAQEASAFESELARAMDSIMHYESHRYKAQRLIAFSNSVPTDPFAYTVSVQMQLDKSASVDSNNILLSDKVESGMFAAYRMYDSITDFSACLTDREKTEYAKLLVQTNTNTIYDGYVHFLNLYHNVPVVITSYGYSTSRTMDSPARTGVFADSRLTEQEQGAALAWTYSAFLEAGCQGAVISSWQDNWARSTWNTMFAVDEERKIFWPDPQTVDAGYGLMAFDMAAASTVTVDGDPAEWTQEDLIAQNGALSLFARYDAGYLYLLVRGVGEDAADALYIPMDITPVSGSNSASRVKGVSFSRPADFLLVVHKTDKTRLLVQARYDAARMAFQERINGSNPFTQNRIPAVDSSLFRPILNVLRVAFDPYTDLIELTAEERAIHNYLGTIEAGLLRHGVADPEDERYDSLADFRFGDTCVEIRLPWQLLNVADPSKMQIHDDYYSHYGVRNRQAAELYLGLGHTGEIDMQPLQLARFGRNVEYRARLKQSYYWMRQLWREAEP